MIGFDMPSENLGYTPSNSTGFDPLAAEDNRCVTPINPYGEYQYQYPDNPS